MKLLNQFGQDLGYKVENWNGKQPPQKITLKGRYCQLESLDITGHTSALYDSLCLNNTADSWTYLPYGPFETIQAFAAWLSSTLAEPDVLLYAILNPECVPIGIAGYLRINPEHGSIEVGHLHFSNLLKRTPAATEAMYLMMRYVFDDLHYRRYEWKCNALNQPSRDAALRYGFKFEGIFRQSNVFKNYNRDTAWFSILDTEWPTLKIRFQKWLDPVNFSTDGQQICRLNELA